MLTLTLKTKTLLLTSTMALIFFMVSIALAQSGSEHANHAEHAAQANANHPTNTNSDALTKISGKVLNLTTKQIVPHQEVTLQIELEDGSHVDSNKSLTDASGFFSFEKVKAIEKANYSLLTKYKDIDYQQSLSLSQTNEAELAVYEPSSDPSIVKIAAYHLVLNLYENQPIITEYLILENASQYSYLSDEISSQAPGGNRVGLKLELPARYSDLEVLEGLMTCCLKFNGNQLLYNHPVKPGMQTVAFQYKVKPSKEVDLSRQLTFNTGRFLALTPNSLPKISSTTLTISDPLQLEGKTYNTYTASNLKRTTSVDFKVKGLKGQMLPKNLGPWLGVALIFAVAGVGSLGAMLYKKPKPPKVRSIYTIDTINTTDTIDTKAEAETETETDAEAIPIAEAIAANTSTSEISELKKGYLEMISSLDALYEKGELSESIYNQLRNAQKLRLGKVLAHLKAEGGL